MCVTVQKWTVLLSVVGPKTYKLLKSLIAPTLPSDKTIHELYQTLKRHVQPTDSVISRRARFYTRKQKDTESVTDFVAELKLLAAECEFDAFLDQALRDIFAIGIGDRETQRKLREAKQLTFAKAVEIALARESVSRELSGTSDKDAAGGMHALGHSSSGARAGGVVAAMVAVGEVSSRAAQAQAPASAIAAARTITRRHESSSSTNVTDATNRVISSQCAAAKSGSSTRKRQGKRKTRKRL